MSELPVIVVGAGGHGKVVVSVLLALGAKVEGIVDADRAKHGGKVLGVPVIGGDDTLPDPKSVILANGIGSVDVPTSRREIYDRLVKRGYSFRSLVHPSAIVAKDVTLGDGAQIMAGAVLQPSVRIGANAIVNTRASIDHDCIIGDHVHIAPGATLSGNVTVGPETHVGAGATVVQGASIGSACLIRAGSLVK
jgi:UDP-perosamine 4-acetyltransferase